jgi:hypothetical protein
MTLFVLLVMMITTYAYIFSIPSYVWIRIRIFFSDSVVSDSFGFGSAILVFNLNGKHESIAQRGCV